MKTYKLNEIKYKRILGRNIAEAGNDEKPLALFWGASALELNIKAKEIWILVSSDYDTHESWISVAINGFATNRFMVQKGEPYWVCIARNLNTEKENLVSIIKDTQPMSDDFHHSLFIHQIGLSENGEFCELKPRKMKLEFIGDSITSGEGLAGNPDEMDWITQWFCASKTYAVQLAKKLNADFSVLSQCGWGICWGWDGNRNSKMPAHYENVCSLLQGDFEKKLGVNEKYIFSDDIDFVIINLGTNDNGAFFQPAWKSPVNGKEYPLHVDENGKAVFSEGKIISDAVKEFLITIRKHNPNAKIIWSFGMIKMVAINEYIESGLNEYKNQFKDDNVYLLELDCMEELEQTDEDKGSRGHPGAKTHRMAAEKLYDFINSIK